MRLSLTIVCAFALKVCGRGGASREGPCVRANVVENFTRKRFLETSWAWRAVGRPKHGENLLLYKVLPKLSNSCIKGCVIPLHNWLQLPVLLKGGRRITLNTCWIDKLKTNLSYNIQEIVYFITRVKSGLMGVKRPYVRYLFFSTFNRLSHANHFRSNVEQYCSLFKYFI